MTIQLPIRFSKADFWEFVQTQEGRFEYERGRFVQQQTGGTVDHWDVAKRMAAILDRQLDPAKWKLFMYVRGVDTPETIRYPDIVVEPAGADRKSLATEVPALLVEVLSKTSVGRDLGTKPAEYTALPSLQAYIVASQDEPECTVWRRGSDGTFAPEPSVIAGRDRSIAVAALGVSIALGEVYEGFGS